jgi:decaprenylphospho-beta-D-erythro-pentofuranosid-2-ulose 2-reductase
MEPVKNIVLLGSTSEIGLAILNGLRLEPTVNLHLIGRESPIPTEIPAFVTNCTFVSCDLENRLDIDEAICYINAIPSIDLMIIAAGYLPPENNDMSIDSIFKTYTINSFGCSAFLSTVALKMSKERKGRIIYISSIATFRPRVKNFTYASSKASAEFFARGIASKYVHDGVKVLIVKPGFVFTKMTTDFKPAPFATSTEVVANIAIKGMEKRKQVVFAPRKLKYITPFLKLFPAFIFRLL